MLASYAGSGNQTNLNLFIAARALAMLSIEARNRMCTGSQCEQIASSLIDLNTPNVHACNICHCMLLIRRQLLCNYFVNLRDQSCKNGVIFRSICENTASHLWLSNLIFRQHRACLMSQSSVKALNYRAEWMYKL